MIVWLKDKLIDLGIVGFSFLTILGFLGMSKLGGIPVSFSFGNNSPEEAYIAAGMFGMLVASMLFRKRNVSQQALLSDWLGYVAERANLFNDPRLKSWSREWADLDETKLVMEWRTRALAIVGEIVNEDREKKPSEL